MKIRIKGNSLRYRLTKTDIDIFARAGYIEETTTFGEQVLMYSLQRISGGQLRATFQNNKITMLMPDDQVNEWITTDRVGFEDNTSALYLLVEKDFVCLDNVLEDQSDNYPNPNTDQC